MLYDLNYSVSKKCRASELMVFKRDSLIPQNELLNQNNIYINLRSMNNDL